MASNTATPRERLLPSIMPGAMSDTEVYGINDNGQNVGFYRNPFAHGFVYDSGAFSILDYPGAIWTLPTAIDDGGQIAGMYTSPNPVDGSMEDHAFLNSAGTLTSIDSGGARNDEIAYPGAGHTHVSGTNDSGQIVGFYVLGGATHGFLYDGRSFTQIDYAGATDTFLYGINGNADIVGQAYLPDLPGAPTPEPVALSCSPAF